MMSKPRINITGYSREQTTSVLALTNAAVRYTVELKICANKNTKHLPYFSTIVINFLIIFFRSFYYLHQLKKSVSQPFLKTN